MQVQTAVANEWTNSLCGKKLPFFQLFYAKNSMPIMLRRYSRICSRKNFTFVDNFMKDGLSTISVDCFGMFIISEFSIKKHLLGY